MLINLNDDEFQKCVEFSKQCAINQQAIEFGQSDTEPRETREISRDNLIGKLAEVAFAKMLECQFGIIVDLDFNYYKRGQWDNQDAEINGWRIDVKGTRQGGRWMLIEWSKLDFRQRENKLSHTYVMASVAWDRELDVPLKSVDLIGCASLNKLQRGIPTTSVLPKDSIIPHTHTRLQADNFGVLFKDLLCDWDLAINYMLTHEPPDTNTYPNPYTGKSLF